ncbi:hypothetical protein K488DRAFT_78728 [Vararia minispora EC-137]|uniref:Uncharacterized protein n=1 Tax=Vararia minispora EC-137 TaxID=1314806 RepID=A0ACB8QK63_9AGAM|nr:hypothetical protein K488DRAFT_78728 [Vararia minispora EC-137]
MPDLLVTGYYRYTDIWFEWALALPEVAMSIPLKSVLSYEALVDPLHPLRLPGKDGIELSMGTFANGEARLLFSSAQVEYIRYWLHAMHLTRELVPLPYSECLIRRSSLQTLAPVVYKDAKSLKGADIDKMNKRLKKGGGADSGLTARRIVFEHVRSLWLQNRGVWCAIDIEAWEMDSTMLTEFGWSFVRWENGQAVEERGHFIVKENRWYTNGKYVPERRMHYNFGESEALTRKEFKERVNALLDSFSQYGSVFLVFHDANQDIKFLRSPAIAAPLENLSYILPDTIKPGLFVVDTSDLFGALLGDSHDRRALERAATQLGLQPTNLHNAGNDAHYTLLALREMAEGGPLDMQRRRRWPTQTVGVKVVQNEEEEDDDDDEWGFGVQSAVAAPKAQDVTETPEAEVLPEANLYAQAAQKVEVVAAA